jgi:hypothetical protein
MNPGELKPGDVLIYDDGRPGHQGVRATVLEVSGKSMVVQFEDRARTTKIGFHEKDWMDFLEVAQ